MKLPLLLLLVGSVAAFADVWSGNDDWINDKTPGYLRLPRTNYQGGGATVMFLNVDHIVRVSVTREATKDAGAKVLIVTSELKPTRLGDNAGANENVTYEIRFPSAEEAEKAAIRIMMKKSAKVVAPRPRVPPPQAPASPDREPEE